MPATWSASGANASFATSTSTSPPAVLLVTGPNGSGKSTLLALRRSTRADERGDPWRLIAAASAIWRTSLSCIAELTALENLDLYGRLYRVPERRERIGMLLERFGLWQARGERVGSFRAA